MSKEYSAALKKTNEWLKKTSYKDIKKVARPNPYPWNFWSAKWSYYLSIILLKCGIKPNEITLAWFFTGIISSLFLWPGTLPFGIAFILLYNFTWHLDFVDGDMARIVHHVCPEYKQNVTGAWLDKFAYSIHKSLVLLGIGVGIYTQTGELLFLILGFSSAYILSLDNLMKVRVTEMLAGKKKLEFIEQEPIDYGIKRKWIGNILVPLIRPEPISILTLAVLFGFMKEILYFYVVLYSIYFVSSFLKINIGLSKIKR